MRLRSRRAEASVRWSNGAAADSFPPKAVIETALRAWTAERLARVMAQIAEAALEVRRQPNLADAIAQRAVLSLASAARRKD